jgi:hypothetical protein
MDKFANIAIKILFVPIYILMNLMMYNYYVKGYIGMLILCGVFWLLSTISIIAMVRIYIKKLLGKDE